MRSKRTLLALLGGGVAAVLALGYGLCGPAVPREVRLVPIRLAGGPELPEAEISALAWRGDELVLLPQYPRRFGPGAGAVFVVPRRAIEDAIDGKVDVVRVRTVPIHAPGLEESFAGFDGYEAIAFAGDDAYLTIEMRVDPERTVGYLLSGRAHGAPLERITIAREPHARLAAQTELGNTGYEALVLDGERVIALYEANGEINPRPRALAFDRALRPLGEIPVGPVEYRVTDASEVDGEGRFWVANYHWPGSPWQPGVCRLTEEHGQGETHARCRTVERLVELSLRGSRIEPTGRAPILFELVDDDHARNWEGLVRLPGRGFLVMTDEHPASILAFVPAP